MNKNKSKEVKNMILDYYNLALQLEGEKQNSQINLLIEKKYSEDLMLLKILDNERKKFFEMGFYFNNIKNQK